MDERGGLKRLAGQVSRHAPGRHFAKLLIYERDQPLARLGSPAAIASRSVVT